MRVIFFGFCFLSFLTTASYSEDKAGFAVRASTLGVGGELAYPISDKVNVRVGLYGLKLNRDEVADNINYKFKANLFNAGALIDYYPWQGIFHLSTGLFYSDNNVKGDAVSGQDLAIGDRTYTPAEVGTLHGVVKANSVAPYLGFGWGKTTKSKSRFKLLFDVGMMLHGTPQVALTPEIPDSSPLNLDPAQRAEFDANLNKEVASFQEDISGYKVYPVVSFGFGIKF